METSKNGSINHTPSESLKMRELIEAINEYCRTRTENSALIIKKFLQAYSVTIDASAFDPDTSLGSQFYVSLYELLTKLEPQSQMAWDCVDVLCNACRNCSARQALIDTYQFIPTLSRLLGDQLSNAKKKKLLRLMQELTCGIKLSWQVPHLPHLLKTLTKWVEDNDKEILCLSLGVLVNLCYKNLPAVYMLSRIVDIKKFLRFCLPMKGPLVEVHVCKLMIILDHSHDDIPKKTLLNLIEPTFLSVVESLTKNDPLMLRLVVDFFVDVVSGENAEIMKEYQHYREQVSRLIQLINARTQTPDPDTTPVAQHDPDCVKLVLKFIYTMEMYKLTDLSTLYPKIIMLALDWLHSERVSYQALTILTTITQHSTKTDDDKNVLKLLAAKLPAFLSILQSEASPTNMEGCQRLGSLLQLLRTMLKSNAICTEVLQSMNETVLMKLFAPVLADELNVTNLPKLKVNETTTTSTEHVDTYVYAVGLVNELSQHDARWLELLSTLMENRTIHNLFAIALYGSGTKVKQLVLEMSRYPRFPIEKVASAMESSQNMFCSTGDPRCQANIQKSTDIVYPILSFAQMEILDDTLRGFKRLMTEQNFSNASISQVMELYEYKVASLAHSELSASKSLEAASERCIHLQHRLAQLTAEHNKLGQLIHHYENRLERTNKTMEDMGKVYLEGRKQADEELAKQNKNVAEIENKLKETKLKLLEMTEVKTNLEDQLSKCKQVIQKLEDSGNRLEKQLQKREEQLKNANLHIDTLNLQNQDLQKMLSQKETKLAEVTKQYIATKECLNTITKVANTHLA
ncbi:protein CIP2A [Leptinotarsa decemlineata]|uniref:protein CIP2A n=1 Tax=Leptinotarsa decemlineata TaxID=7539 RepID=UPI003D30B2D1